MSWTTSLTELRIALNDGDGDRLRYRKRVFGQINGENTVFKTFEFRRISDFTESESPVGVYVNGSSVTVSSDDILSGEFSLSEAPVDGDVVEATYYAHWFLDDELTNFLVKSVNWMGLGATVSNVPDGLQPAAIAYAQFEAYTKLAVKWREMYSVMYRLEDEPDQKGKTQAQEYLEMAKFFFDLAHKLRKNYYGRNDQAEAPLFRSISGNVREVTPRT